MQSPAFVTLGKMMIFLLLFPKPPPTLLFLLLLLRAVSVVDRSLTRQVSLSPPILRHMRAQLLKCFGIFWRKRAAGEEEKRAVNLRSNSLVIHFYANIWMIL